MADIPKQDPPAGMENYDLKGDNNLGALSEEQQEKLNKFKIKTRLENEAYLREHPEVECLLNEFLRDILTKRPDNIREFAASYFTHPDRPELVYRALEARQKDLKQNKVLQNVYRENTAA